VVGAFTIQAIRAGLWFWEGVVGARAAPTLDPERSPPRPLPSLASVQGDAGREFTRNPGHSTSESSAIGKGASRPNADRKLLARPSFKRALVISEHGYAGHSGQLQRTAEADAVSKHAGIRADLLARFDGVNVEIDVVRDPNGRAHHEALRL
jgi:hypothetical protein